MNAKRLFYSSWFLVGLFLIFSFLVRDWTYVRVDGLASSLAEAGMPEAQVRAIRLHLPFVLSPLENFIGAVSWGLSLALVGITGFLMRSEIGFPRNDKSRDTQMGPLAD